MPKFLFTLSNKMFAEKRSAKWNCVITGLVDIKCPLTKWNNQEEDKWHKDRKYNYLLIVSQWWKYHLWQNSFIKDDFNFLIGQGHFNGMSVYLGVSLTWDWEIYRFQLNSSKADIILWIFLTWWSLKEIVKFMKNAKKSENVKIAFFSVSHF